MERGNFAAAAGFGMEKVRVFSGWRVMYTPPCPHFPFLPFPYQPNSSSLSMCCIRACVFEYLRLYWTSSNGMGGTCAHLLVNTLTFPSVGREGEARYLQHVCGLSGDVCFGDHHGPSKQVQCAVPLQSQRRR